MDQDENGPSDVPEDILGWDFNGITFCISLPTPKVQKLRKSTKEGLHIKSLSLKKFQKLVVRLQHSAIGITARKWIFQRLNTDLQKIPSTINISMASELEIKLEDWITILSNIYQRTASI